MDADSALLMLDMGDRVELAARELLAALDNVAARPGGGRWQPSVLDAPAERLRRALGAAAARRLAARAELEEGRR